jgi:phosphatidate cytidylyltransferase
LAPLGLAAIWLGGIVWAALLALVALGLGLEWARLCRGLGRVALAPGLLYVAAAAATLLWLRLGGAGLANVVFVVLVVWASDIGAYLSGRLIGGPKLAPRLSPGKTWAGSVGGLACAMVVGASIAWGFGGGHRRAATLLAALLCITAQAGDLAESAMKRRSGHKDSGRLIPGHGGLLDRLDGLLAAAPVAALISLASGPGVPLWQ